MAPQLERRLQLPPCKWRHRSNCAYSTLTASKWRRRATHAARSKCHRRSYAAKAMLAAPSRPPSGAAARATPVVTSRPPSGAAPRATLAVPSRPPSGATARATPAVPSQPPSGAVARRMRHAPSAGAAKATLAAPSRPFKWRQPPLRRRLQLPHGLQVVPPLERRMRHAPSGDGARAALEALHVAPPLHLVLSESLSG